jgi:hypothetical protein
MCGFVADSREVTATKVDDTFTLKRARAAECGESLRHMFKI